MNLNNAALHPHFNNDGSKLLFANRIPTGNIIPALIGITPGGENHWDGWGMHIADFDMSKSAPLNYLITYYSNLPVLDFMRLTA